MLLNGSSHSSFKFVVVFVVVVVDDDDDDVVVVVAEWNEHLQSKLQTLQQLVVVFCSKLLALFSVNELVCSDQKSSGPCYLLCVFNGRNLSSS